MKNKQLKLAELKVRSFVTEVDKDQLKGGGDTLKPTAYSCLDYMSCHFIQCVATRNDDICRIDRP